MNTPMTPEQLEREWQQQAKAEHCERSNASERDEPAIDQYRLIHRVLKQTDVPALPENFASLLAQQVQDFEERAQFENSALAILAVIAVITSLVFAMPLLLQSMTDFTLAIALPWPLLWAATFALGFATMVDRASKRYWFTH
ncbi:MAG: hypothetical protein ABIP02_02445 [Arenimonas sp.]